MSKHLKEYIRDRKGNKVGLIIGFVHKNMIVVGWSKANLKAGDKFDHAYGMNLALNRALSVIPTPELDPSLKSQMREFQMRCLRYFQDATVMSTGGGYVAPESASDSIEKALEKDIKDFMQKLVLGGEDGIYMNGAGLVAGIGGMEALAEWFSPLFEKS